MIRITIAPSRAPMSWPIPAHRLPDPSGKQRSGDTEQGRENDPHALAPRLEHACQQADHETDQDDVDPVGTAEQIPMHG
jgi:hypothetical protein